MKNYWKVIGWFGILVLVLWVSVYFFLLSLSCGRVVDMENGYFVSPNPTNIPLLHLKKAAYYEGYNHYEQFKTKKGPSYPKSLFNDVSEPSDKKEQKKIYDAMYEKGWKDAKNEKHENVIKGRM